MMAIDSKQVGSLFLTSPRLRGEVGLRFSAIRVRGPLREAEPAETPPHPNPLPARGERGRAVLGSEA
jgi:hypothetical protein